MSGQIFSLHDNRKFVASHSTQFEEQTGLDEDLVSKALALSGMLQTTLDLDELITLFFKQLNRVIQFDGILYQQQEQQVEIPHGLQTGHRCSYELLVATDELGTLELIRTTRFSDNELESIENLLVSILYPLRNALLYKKAQQTAMIDPLTGARNRASMDSTMRREIELARRHDSPLSIILLDIDHFKGINDTYGHLHGDKALSSIAQCAEKTIRESDLLFRYGGEEFLILLTNTGSQGANLLAERIRIAVEDVTHIPNSDQRITASLGVTTLQDDDDQKIIFKRVDDALYQAKKSGRNKVIIR
ncbi:MAG: GGDEF domain-containing protein [Candidatus Sedimenticola sp. 6PFRAG7]